MVNGTGTMEGLTWTTRSSFKAGRRTMDPPDHVPRQPAQYPERTLTGALTTAVHSARLIRSRHRPFSILLVTTKKAICNSYPKTTAIRLVPIDSTWAFPTPGDRTTVCRVDALASLHAQEFPMSRFTVRRVVRISMLWVFVAAVGFPLVAVAGTDAPAAVLALLPDGPARVETI